MANKQYVSLNIYLNKQCMSIVVHSAETLMNTIRVPMVQEGCYSRKKLDMRGLTQNCISGVGASHAASIRAVWARSDVPG